MTRKVLRVRHAPRPAFGINALRRLLVVIFSLFALPAVAFDGHTFGRDGLWRVVHGVCAPVSRVTGIAAPCLAVDHDRGFATVRAPDDATHIIVTPLAKVPGVESAGLLRPDAPNYWADAWSQRSWVVQGAGKPLAWDDLGMAINSLRGRSQDQLHIHVDCVDPRLKRVLIRATSAKKGWSDVDLSPWAGRYRAKLLRAEDLDQNIFRLVATDIPHARDHMERETIALIGVEDAKIGRGFILIESSNGGHAEELLDHNCRLARN